MPSSFSKTFRRISQLLIIAQVGLMLWHGQSATAQSDMAVLPPSGTANLLSYSQSNVMLMVGSTDDQSPYYSVDKSSHIIGGTYLGINQEQELLDRQMLSALLDTINPSGTDVRVGPTLFPEDLAQRYGHTATVLSNGKVLIAGGTNGHEPLSTATIYDPATKQFTPSKSHLQYARAWHSATLLPSGDVLILGGATSRATQLSDSVANWPQPYEGAWLTETGEVYLTQEDRFVSLSDWYHRQNITTNMTTDMLSPRARHSATLLPGTNKVLVVGAPELNDAASASLTPQQSGSGILQGCDPPNPYKDEPYMRFSCGVHNPNIQPGETTAITLQAIEESPLAKRTGRAKISIKAEGDLKIISNNGTKKMSRTNFTLSPFASSSADRQHTFEVGLVVDPQNPTALQWGQLSIHISFQGESRDYSASFVGVAPHISQNSSSAALGPPAPSAPFSVNNFLLYDYDPTNPYHDSISTANTALLSRSIRSLGHTTSFPTRSDEFSTLQPYGAQQIGERVMYATSVGQRDNRLSALNQVANTLGIRIDPNIIIPVDQLGDIGNRPDAIVIFNGGNVEIGPIDNGEWSDPIGLYAEVIDLKTGHSAPLPGGLAPTALASVYPLSDGRAIIAGGGLGKIYVYNAITNSLKPIGSLTLPRRNMQMVVRHNSADQPVELMLIGGTPLDTKTASTMARLSASGKLPMDSIDLNTLEITNQSPTIPILVGPVGEAITAVGGDASQKLDQACRRDFTEYGIKNVYYDDACRTKFITKYASQHNLSPSVLSGALQGGSQVDRVAADVAVGRPLVVAGQQLVSPTYTVPLKQNLYFVTGSTGSAIWDLNTNTAEILYLPTRIPIQQYSDSSRKNKIGVPRVIGEPTNFAWSYDGSQLSVLPNGDLLTTGGLILPRYYRERIRQGGTRTQLFTTNLSAIAAGELTGIGIVGLGTILGAASFAMAMIIAATNISTSIINATKLMLAGGQEGFQNIAYGATVQSNWLFTIDPYPDEPISGETISEIVRDKTQNSDLLAPPKEELAPSKPAPDQQVAGKNSGYKLELTFDKTELNPYPGSTVTGTVKAVDASGKVVPMQGAVDLYVGAGTSTLNIAKDSSSNLSQLSASESHKILTAPDQWSTKSQPVGYYSGGVTSDGHGYVTSGATTISQLPKAPTSSVNPDTGAKSIDQALAVGPYGPLLTNKPIVQLNNGVGTFTYQSQAHQYDNVTFAVTGQEQPIFPARDSKYTGTQTYANNDPTKPIGCGTGANIYIGCSNLEPMDVRNQRLSTPTGYQILPDLTASIPQKTVPNQPNKTEPAASTSPIATVKTLKFADYKSSAAPVLGPEINSTAGYYYDITSTAPLQPKQGDKFTVTIVAKPKSGQSLPADVYNGVTLSVMNGYQVYNKNYTVNGKTGNFIATYPAAFAENSDINKAVPGGWAAPAGIIEQLSFNIGKDPVTFELEYTGEPSQTDTLSFNIAVRDMHVIPVSDRFKAGVGGLAPSLPPNIQAQIKQTMREVIPLKFAQ